MRFIARKDPEKGLSFAVCDDHSAGIYEAPDDALTDIPDNLRALVVEQVESCLKDAPAVLLSYTTWDPSYDVEEAVKSDSTSPVDEFFDSWELTPLRACHLWNTFGELWATLSEHRRDARRGVTVELPEPVFGQLEQRLARDHLATHDRLRDTIMLAGGREGNDVTGARVVWVREDGMRGAAETLLELELAVAAVAEGRREVQRHDGGMHFINPYTHVPFPDKVERGRPSGHHLLADGHYSGWFDWQLTFLTKLLLPADQAALNNQPLRYPGTSLRGVLRSHHEVLAGGCLRVVDPDETPVHREVMNVYNDRRYRLVVVKELHRTTRAVTKVELTDRPVWVHEACLAGLPGGLPFAGMKLEVDEDHAREEHAKGRRESESGVKAGSTHVIHLTRDAPNQGREPLKHRYHPAGRLLGTEVDVTPQVWETFQEACRGSQDCTGENRQGERRPPDTSQYSPGDPGWPKEPITRPRGQRRKVDGWLGVGDTVWAVFEQTPGRSALVELKPSVVWRHRGKHPVKTRLPSADDKEHHLLPCADPEHLCPSCQVFGSIDNTRKEKGEDTEHRAYRSHVSVGFGFTGPVTSSTINNLPPLRSPNLSAGGFRLETPPGNHRGQAGENDITLAHWGSTLDGGAPRLLKGRAFHWHGQTNGPHGGRHRWRNSLLEGQKGKAEACPQGTTLTARVRFNNLTVEQLGLLLGAAEPGRLLEGTNLAVHVGRGKPLGFGSATAVVKDLHLFTAASRYCGGDEVDAETVAEAAAAEARKVPERRPDVGRCWEALKKVLTFDAVAADRIWYPTTFSLIGVPDPKLDRSFLFFSENSGGRNKPLTPLPDALGATQYLPINPDEN